MTDHEIAPRRELVERLAARLMSAPSSSIVLRGTAGIGKSHTVREIVAAVSGGRAEPAPALGGAADSFTSPGLSVRRLAGGPAVRSLAFGALLPLLPSDAEPITVEFELVQRLRAAMVPQGVERRLVVVDDIGLVDDKSAGLLELLLRSGDVTLVATERTPLTGPPDEHALSPALREHADIVEVPPMSDLELADLVQEWLGPGEVGAVQHLVAVSQGNPLVARELVEAARASGAVVRRGDLWFLDGFRPTGHTLERLVGEHLARLGQSEWQLVRCLAVAGELPRTVVERVDGEAVARLERAGVVRGSPVALGHPLYEEVSRASMTVDETSRICRKLLAVVGPDDDVDAALLGRWLLAAGDSLDDDVARAGARRALARWENDLAVELLETIVTPTVADLVSLQWAHANAGRVNRALALADRAVASATTDVERVDATIARAELLCLQLDRAEEGCATLVDLRASVADPDLVVRVDGATALYSRMTGNAALATESVERVRSAADSDDPAVRVPMLLGEAFGSVFGGRFAEAGPIIAEGTALALARHEQHNVVRFEVAEALRRLFLGDLPGSGEMIDHALRRSDLDGVRPANVAWLGLASQLAQLEGRFDVAERRGREAVRMAEHVDDLGAGGFVRGDLCALAAEFERSVEFDPRSSPIGLARLRVRVCDVADADVTAAELASMAIDAGYVLWAPWIAREAIRRAVAPASAELLATLADQLEGPVVSAMADHAQGMVDGDLERVESAAREFLACRCVVPAIDAGLDAMSLALRHGPSVPLRHALLEFARVMALVTPDAPPRLARRYDDLVDAADMPSARQLEIAAMAAGGSASKEIAERLHLSARTVDNHLAAVYRSLGVSNRAELADLGLA